MWCGIAWIQLALVIIGMVSTDGKASDGMGMKEFQKISVQNSDKEFHELFDSSNDENDKKMLHLREIFTESGNLKNDAKIDFTTFSSKYPSSSPSSIPSALPSSFPSEMPSSRPTDAPTSVPSAIPTFRSTAHPSSAPSGQPSDKPSAQPSSQPSTQPTSQPTNPTFSPTFRPSPSSQPTGQQTKQSTSVVNTQGTLQTNGNTNSNPSQAGIQAAMNTVSNMYGGSAHYQNYTSTPETSSSVMSTALDFIGGRRLTSEILYVYIFHFTVEYNMVDYPQFNGNITKLIVQVQQNVTKSIDSGAATVYLRNQAVYLGATEMTNATTTASIFTYTVVPVPSSPHTARLTDGQIAGLVVGIVVGAILLLTLIYCLVVRKRNTTTYKQDFVLNQQTESNIGGKRVPSGYADDSMVIYVDEERDGHEKYSQELSRVDEETRV